MSLLLRVISRPRWYKEDWLEDGKAQAKALLDLRPIENKLSFWHVEDDESNLNRVIAAITAGKDNCPENFDYALFDQSLLEETSVRIEQTPGGSFHKEADKNWHRDTTNLSADNVVEIVNIMVRHVRDRIYKRAIIRMLKEEVDSGLIDIASLKEKLKQKWEREIVRVLKEEIDSGLIDIASLKKEKLKQKWSSHWLEQLPS